MNEHIALVKKWLANKDSVTQEELEANADAAEAASDADAASYAARYAAYSATDADYAAYYVKQYEELTK